MMAIPRKNSRRITVDDEPFRWRVRHRPTYLQWQRHWEGNGCMAIAVEHAEKTGAVLVVNLKQTHPTVSPGSDVLPVVPSQVEHYIHKALEAGWQPDQPGKTFVLNEETDRDNGAG